MWDGITYLFAKCHPSWSAKWWLVTRPRQSSDQSLAFFASIGVNQNEFEQKYTSAFKICLKYPVQKIIISSSSHYSEHGLTLIPAWISNYIHYNVWAEINFPFLNPNGATIEVQEWINNFILHFSGYVITYQCLGLKLIHVSERVPGLDVLGPTCSYECYNVSNHRQFDCLFNNMWRPNLRKISNLHMTGLMWGKSNNNRWFHLINGLNMENISFQCAIHGILHYKGLVFLARSTCKCHPNYNIS